MKRLLRALPASSIKTKPSFRRDLEREADYTVLYILPWSTLTEIDQLHPLLQGDALGTHPKNGEMQVRSRKECARDVGVAEVHSSKILEVKQIDSSTAMNLSEGYNTCKGAQSLVKRPG